MEKRTCKLCFKTFSNGRALGGHMRSHMLKLQTSPPPPPALPTPPTPVHDESDESDSSSSSQSFSEELNYKLRENPKKSFRLVDPEFSSFPVDANSIVVQDRESETESSKNPSRRRSKRNRKSGFGTENSFLMMLMNKNKKYRASSTTPIEQPEPEPVSSVSDTTPEEDVAWCLMMLSRGITEVDDFADGEEEQEEESEEEEIIKVRAKRSRGKYQCGTCKKYFRSYQALGGHRASHKKMKSCNTVTTFTTPSSSTLNQYEEQQEEGNVVPNTASTVKIHECPVCFRVFGSGQALGGHKRSHLTGGSAVSTSSFVQTPIRQNHSNSSRFEEQQRMNFNMIDLDLNLPAPMEDENDFQIEELSAVSDAEFVHGNSNNHH